MATTTLASEVFAALTLFCAIIEVLTFTGLAVISVTVAGYELLTTQNMNKNRNLYLAVVACLFCLRLPCLAGDFGEVKLYAGYQYSRLDTHAVQDAFSLQHAIDPAFPLLNFGNYQNLNGWNAGLEEGAFAKWFSVVADVSGSYGTNSINLGTAGNVTTRGRTRLRFFTFTIGPQFTLHLSRSVQPFARVLVGGGWQSFSANVLANNVPQSAELKSSDNGFAYGAGVGSDFFFTRQVGLRVAADALRTNLFNDAQNNVRGTVGLILRF